MTSIQSDCHGVYCPTKGSYGSRHDVVAKDGAVRKSTSLSQVLSGLTVVSGFLGVLLHAIQRVDPTPTIAYFTVWVVALTAVAHLWCLVRPRSSAAVWLRNAATSSAIVSGLVYFLVIVPLGNLHVSDGAVVWLANFFLHASTPVLSTVVCTRARTEPQVSVRDSLTWLSFPVAYGIIVAVLATATSFVPPYDFLRPSQMGVAGVIASCFGALAIFVLVGLGLRSLVNRTRVGEPLIQPTAVRETT